MMGPRWIADAIRRALEQARELDKPTVTPRAETEHGVVSTRCRMCDEPGAWIVQIVATPDAWPGVYCWPHANEITQLIAHLLLAANPELAKQLRIVALPVATDSSFTAGTGI